MQMLISKPDYSPPCSEQVLNKLVYWLETSLANSLAGSTERSLLQQISLQYLNSRLAYQ